jgi:DNA-binding LacI/PurR family transcriptional regulator
MVDVGRLAGVSAQTVSRYFTGNGYVSTETREKIEDAIRELDYTFNQSARNLRVNATQTIGVLTTGPSLFGSWSILAGINEAAQANGYGLFTSQVNMGPDDADEREAIHRALERLQVARVDGIIVTSPYAGIEDLLEKIWETVPVVILAGRSWPKIDSVILDSYEAGLVATNHLVKLGHTRIVHIAGPADRNEAHERERGYRDSLSRAGIEPLPVIRGDWSGESGFDVGADLGATDFTAVFSGNDQMALGFMSAMRRRNLHAPIDYSIVGVDDMPDARFFAPPLTTVFMDFVAQGRAGFTMITTDERPHKRPAHQIIKPRLVVRESTAPPRP